MTWPGKMHWKHDQTARWSARIMSPPRGFAVECHEWSDGTVWEAWYRAKGGWVFMHLQGKARSRKQAQDRAFAAFVKLERAVEALGK